jgi:hypothetical protein
MSNTSCARSALLVPMCWLRAGGNLSRPNHIHTRAVHPFTRAEGILKCPGRSPDLPFVQICKWCRAGIRPAIHLDPDINSP